MDKDEIMQKIESPHVQFVGRTAFAFIVGILLLVFFSSYFNKSLSGEISPILFAILSFAGVGLYYFLIFRPTIKVYKDLKNE